METMTREQEIATKYGVPTPETCQELNWQEETNFAWLRNIFYNEDDEDSNQYDLFMIQRGLLFIVLRKA